VNPFATARRFPFVSNPTSEKKILAGVLGIVLGPLGIHKFVLGYTEAGIIMLLVSIVAFPFTCGMSYAVMQVIGLVEGILYLTKSDEEFKARYLDQKQPWF